MARILSIEIDNRNIKIVEGSKHGNSLNIYNSVILDVEKGSIDDGNIEDVDTVSENIQETLKIHDIKTKKAILITNTNSIITRTIELPLLKSKKDMMSMIKNELEQLISVDLNQYTLIYKQIDIINADEGIRGRFIVYGIPLHMYNKFMELAEKLKLEVISIDLSFNSLDKFAYNRLTINKNSFNKSVTSAFIDFGYEGIGFSVVANGMNGFFRILSSGIKDMVRNYATVYGLSHDEALKEVYKISLSSDYEKTDDISKLNIAENVINGWIDEFNRYIRYYNSNNKENQINKIYLYGTYGNIKGLDEFLSNHLNMEVETINNVSGINIKNNELIDRFDLKVYLNTVLSLYSDKKDINFLYDAKKRSKTKYSTGVAVAAIGLVALLGISFYVYNQFTQKMHLEREIAAFNEFIENSENQKSNSEAVDLIKNTSLIEKYNNQINIVKGAIASEDAVTTIMFEEIGKALPLGSRINSMSMDNISIQMQCKSNSKLEVAQFEKNLKSIEFIDYVYIPAVVESSEGGNIDYSYSVVCGIKDVISYEAQ